MTEQAKKPLVLDAKFLGRFEIRINGCQVGGFSTQKTKALAVYLIFEHKQEHSRNKLAALFWPDAPEQTALHNLRQALSAIRKAFDVCGCGDVLNAGRETVTFTQELKVKVDALEFETQLRQMMDHYRQQPGRGFAIQRMRRLLSTYHGEILGQQELGEGGLFEDWLILRRERLNHLAVEGASLLLEYYEKRGEWGEAKNCAELLVRLAPWDENAHSRLVEVFLQLEQGNAALAHYRAALRYFTDVLEVEPEDQLKKAYESIQEFFSKGVTAPRRKIVPVQVPCYTTPFIGRENELETLEDWVADPSCSVITVTGPGGSGKTRLAARLAESQRGLFVDGVYFVSIEDCCSIDQLAARILSTVSELGEHSANPLSEFLEWVHNRCALLVLDNVDSCSDCAELVVKITEVTRQVLFVFTSYSRIDLVGERVFALKGLSTCDGEESDAFKLFFSHIKHENKPGHQSPQFVENVLRICNLVEGLPLAIDLAAGQAKQIPCEEILASLTEDTKVLTSKAINLPERHRSITASFENSWKRLSPSLQQALTSLTVFESPFSPEAAQAVCGIHSDEIRNLSLHSFLMRENENHYKFHRVIKQMAGEKFDHEKIRAIDLYRNHAQFINYEFKKAYERSPGPGFLPFISWTESVFQDLIKSTRYLISSRDWTSVQQVIHPLFCYLDGKGLLREGSSLLEELAELCAPVTDGHTCQAMFSSRAARLLLSIQQFDRASELLDFSSSVFREEQNKDEEAFYYNVLAMQAILRKSSSASEEFAQKAFLLARETGNRHEEAHSLYNTGYAAINSGDNTRAEVALSKCRSLCETLGDWRRLTKVLNLLADVACNKGQYEQALTYYDEALKMVVAIGNRYSESLVLNNIGTAYISLHQHEKAKEYYNKSLLLCREIGDREGEAIALSNLGELFAENGSFNEGALYNQRALEICLAIESDWGEVSARVMLATCYRELGDKATAQEEVIRVLQKSADAEFTTFFYRGVIEASLQLLERGRGDGLASIVEEIIRSEETDDWTRRKGEAVLAKLPGNKAGSTSTNDLHWVASMLIEALRK